MRILSFIFSSYTVGKKNLDSTPIPDRLNALLVVGTLACSLFLLWAGSHSENLFWEFGLGIIYAYLMLTNYSLLHEAGHNKLQTNPRRDYLLGLIPAFLFPVSLTLLRRSHIKHHLQNRSDDELFDLYYPDDSLTLKYLQWYGILTGFFWFYPPLATLMFALLPQSLIRKLFKNCLSARAYTTGFMPSEIFRIRIELALFVLFFTLVFLLLDLRFSVLLIFYGLAAINWSTRQFVEHAYTVRDLVEGTYNLRHTSWMSWLLLHREMDLNHHRHPDIPWLYLPKLLHPEEARISYIRQYWRMWLGPQPASRFTKFSHQVKQQPSWADK